MNVPFIILMLNISVMYCSLYTSTVKLCELLQVELHNLNIYEEKLPETRNSHKARDILKEIRTFVPVHIFNQTRFADNECLDENSFLSRFVTNPLNAYMLVKRHYYYWYNFLEEVRKINQNTSELFNKHVFQPKYEEVEGVDSALYILGQYYNIEQDFFSNNTLFSTWAKKRENYSYTPIFLKFEDAYRIGRLAFNQIDYHSCVVWMTYAFNMIRRKENVNRKSLADIAGYLSWSEYEIGMSQEAYQHCVIQNEMEPNNKRIIANLKLFNDTKQTTRVVETHKDYVIGLLKNKNTLKYLKRKLKYFKDEVSFENDMIARSLSKILCQTGHSWDLNLKHLYGTKCYEKTGGNTFGKLIKTNVEKIHHDPEIFIFRNIISSDHIDQIKYLVKDRLKPAKVNNPATGMEEPVKYRVSRSAWLETHDVPIIKNLLNKIKVATGLTLTSSEFLHVGNYGVGGYYDPHYDFVRENSTGYFDSIIETDGRRLATFMIFMSNTEFGGGIAFPNLGITVKPSKGDAIFWYNLHLDGTGDARTKHTLCPVALGTKWDAILWIRTRGEELSRPCNLKQQNGI